ncbi:MAG: hypothetical protein PHU77_00385 [Simplicispira sp.]|nr:hypothetical protein [Simplicispira sp.]
MSDKELLELAREAGIVEYDGCGFFVCSAEVSEIVRFAALAAAAEREACAAIAQATVCDTHIPTGIKIYGTRAAAAIRAMSRQ